MLRAVARALGIGSDSVSAPTAKVVQAPAGVDNGQGEAPRQRHASKTVTPDAASERDCQSESNDSALYREAPVATDADREPPTLGRPQDRVSVAEPISTIEARPPADHAIALVAWLQGPGGRTGTISATELEQMHWELCHELGWEVVNWVAVGRELRRLLGAKKEYVRHEDGRRVRVYRIPPARTAGFMSTLKMA